LVFHDIDKTISVYIHFFPMLLTFCSRWMVKSAPNLADEKLTVYDFSMAILLYTFWQLSYCLITEILKKPILDADPNLKTSLRWLSSDSKNGMNKLAKRICTKLHIMELNEEFDSDSLKTKTIFIVSQLLVTVLNMVPVPAIYAHYWVNLVFVLLMFSYTVWNGGNFYIEIFSRRYWKEMEDKERLTKVELDFSNE